MIYSKTKEKWIPNKKYEIMIDKMINRIIRFQIRLQLLPTEIVEDNDYGSYFDNFVDGRGF